MNTNSDLSITNFVWAAKNLEKVQEKQKIRGESELK